jgi:hypothetical protein
MLEKQMPACTWRGSTLTLDFCDGPLRRLADTGGRGRLPGTVAPVGIDLLTAPSRRDA